MTQRPGPYEQFVDDARLRRARPAARRGRRARRLDGGARVRLGARSASTAPCAARTAPSQLDPVLAARDLHLSPDDRDRIGGSFFA